MRSKAHLTRGSRRDLSASGEVFAQPLGLAPLVRSGESEDARFHAQARFSDGKRGLWRREAGFFDENDRTSRTVVPKITVWRTKDLRMK